MCVWTSSMLPGFSSYASGFIKASTTCVWSITGETAPWSVMCRSVVNKTSSSNIEILHYPRILIPILTWLGEVHDIFRFRNEQLNTYWNYILLGVADEHRNNRQLKNRPEGDRVFEQSNNGNPQVVQLRNTDKLKTFQFSHPQRANTFWVKPAPQQGLT